MRSAVPTGVMQAGSCDECRDTGFRGRQGIYEVMQVNQELAALKRLALKHGLRPLNIAAAQKNAHGESTLDEVTRVVSLAET